MKHSIEQKNEFKILGWKRHMSCYSQIDGMENEWAIQNTGRNKGDQYNVELPASAAGASSGFVYAIGRLYEDTMKADGYEIITIPGGRYVVFPVPEEDLDDVGHFKGQIHEFITTAGYECVGTEIEHIKTSTEIEVSFLIA